MTNNNQKLSSEDPAISSAIIYNSKLARALKFKKLNKKSYLISVNSIDKNFFY